MPVLLFVLLLEGWGGGGPWDGPNYSLFVGVAGAASHLSLKDWQMFSRAHVPQIGLVTSE